MAYTIENLRQKTDDELIVEHDERAALTVVGTAYFMDELERRSRERATAAALTLAESSLALARASTDLARRSFWLGVGSGVLSAVATAVAILALLTGR